MILQAVCSGSSLYLNLASSSGPFLFSMYVALKFGMGLGINLVLLQMLHTYTVICYIIIYLLYYFRFAYM